jgi:hypothetical protein
MDKGKDAMECNRCGGPMMLETVIKLRRRFIGFRETRSQGAYCATCRIAVPVENHPAATIARARKITREPLPTWRYADLWPTYQSQPSIAFATSGRRTS